MRQLNVWAILGIWAGLSLGAALYAAWEGYEGRAFAATVATFSILLLVMLVFAARGVAEGLAGRFGSGGGVFLWACVFVAVLVFFVGGGGVWVGGGGGGWGCCFFWSGVWGFFGGAG